MNILVLGNGFDLAHNLPTRYTNFLEYVIEQRDLGEAEHTNIYELVRKNIWIDYFVRLYQMNLLRGINWIDFELEISHILKIFDEHDSNIYNKIAPLSELNKDKKLVLFYNLYAIRCNCPDGIRDVPKQSYAQLIENMESDMEKMIKAFEIYLIEKVEEKDVVCISPNIQEVNANRIISFNYTHIYEKLYSGDKSKVHHIHGEVKRDASISNNMVLGVDEYWDKEEAHRHTLQYIQKIHTKNFKRNRI